MPAAARAHGNPEPAIGQACGRLGAALAGRHRVDLSWLRPAPSETGWELAPDALQLLLDLTARSEARRVIELGSGISTLALAGFCRRHLPRTEIQSLENDPDAHRRTAHLLEGAEGHRVELTLAPLVARRCNERLVPVYHVAPAPRRPADLALVDGPNATLGGRSGAIAQAVGMVRPGGIVLVDDADRPAEKEAIGWLTETADGAIIRQDLPGFTKGLVALIPRTELGDVLSWRSFPSPDARKGAT